MYTLRNSAMTTMVDDELVILDPEGGKYYGLNPSGTRILEILLASSGLEECTAAIALEYDVEPGRARTDLEAFIKAMEVKGLLLES